MWVRQAWAVFRKDVVLEARSRANFNALLFFAGLVLLIFSFALGSEPKRLHAAAGGLLWLAFVFAGTLTFGRAYQIEAENNAFEGLLLVAQSRSAIYLGKLLGAAAVMLAIELCVVPLMAILYSMDLWSAAPALVVTGILGTIGYAAVGALYGALTMRLRAREVLLPLLMLPVTVPVILAAVTATTYAFNGENGHIWIWLELLIVFDIIFVTAGLMTFEYVVTE